MRTQMIHMLQSTYPFGESGESDPNNRILIKQTLPKQTTNFTQMLRLSKLSKKLSQNKIFIKLQTILEEEQNLCLLYEYVPIRVSKYIKAMDEKFLKQYRHQLFEVAEILAENRVIATIDMENMGLNEKYEAKYFLGMDFVQKKQVNIYELKNDYVEEIKRIFAPYLNSEALVVPKKTSKNLVKVENRLSDTQEIQNISSYIDSNNNLVKTRKHESIYYQKDTNKQINKRKESYMSSVSNLRLNNLYRRINQIELQVCNTKTPSKSGFKFSIEGREFTSKSSIDKKALQGHRLKGITNGINRNSNTINSTSLMPKNNYVKYPGYENQEDQNEQMSQLEEYEKSIRSNKPNRYAIKNTLEMSAHTKLNQTKKPYKKFSTQFPSLSDLQQPLMTLTNAMRISANGLDKQERKVNKKIEMFKERQYSEMKSVSGNANYMRDFMSVLEQETSTNQRTSKHNENENESQEGEHFRPPAHKIGSQNSIEDVEFQKFGSQELHKPHRPFPHQQLALTSYSHTNLPQHKHVITPLSQSNQQIIDTKLKSKTSIQQDIDNSNIHNRVKGVIENSKKLIEKLKEKAKKNV